MADILLVDDDQGFSSSTKELLEMLDHQVSLADSVQSAREAIDRKTFDIVFLDLMLPDGSGLQLIDAVSSQKHQPFIAIITGNSAVKSLIDSVIGSNICYLVKPIDLDQLKQIIAQASAPAPKKRKNDNAHFDLLIGESPAMKTLYQMIERVSQTPANVLIQGESGVGKELVANAIHNASSHSGPFVAANCGAITRELIGSELFGHEKGAFTGAIGRKAGLFEQADQGTLFLDEITEMPIDMQPNLLRVLETNTVTRLGSTTSTQVKCRVVSATNRTSTQMAEENCLREDLYFRLAVFPIEIPPLRERSGDIPLLAHYFLEKLNTDNGTAMRLSEQSIDQLSKYTWPGNVRELRHAIHRAFIMTEPASATLELPSNLASPFAQNNASQPTVRAGRSIDEVEKELIMLTLKQVNDDKPKAAEMLGISLKTLYNRLNNYEN